ncbi:uncharacterized protein H6S33_004931 [Morchella sextelata]|uniref:uncharacterized protein n=1 Tax=Morchella sextelata TaxID=1174677 RepID=UPI001D056A39|nr:uncharacterized protein H6S33_004931 [Morchella sextelata]KAH0604949.1 hypothetical protein H6S33_004931 [Morchella sextelata]
MGIPLAALIPLILMAFLVVGGVIAFAKIATTPEPQPYSAYYMYSSNYETVPDRSIASMSVVTTPERVYVPPGDVERGLGPGRGGGGMGGREMGMGGRESRMSGGSEGRMSAGMGYMGPAAGREMGGGMGYMAPGAGAGREMGGGTGMGYMGPADGGREMDMGGAAGAGGQKQMVQT